MSEAYSPERSRNDISDSRKQHSLHEDMRSTHNASAAETRSEPVQNTQGNLVKQPWEVLTGVSSIVFDLKKLPSSPINTEETTMSA
ncbi:hypothetical protein PR048_005145 [Dryococelus australis]|uniref:Uncharacterized protein n=1 Tax=Dryococelus australis TaxID=614101 RepID=A0ABQ9I7D7_9NEOP|nr:hypothetical protein PR048_005145 [Dryococelus australis]